MAKAPEKPKYAPPEWLQKKKQEVMQLGKTVEEMRENLEKQRQAKQRESAKKDICFWMDNAIFPFLEGIAEGFNEPLLLGIQRLIKEKKNPFRPKEDWDRTKDTDVALRSFLVNPRTRMLQILVKPYIKVKMEWINKEAKWIREEILKEEYPGIYDAIMETKGGKEWLDELITDFIKTLKKLTR